MALASPERSGDTPDVNQYLVYLASASPRRQELLAQIRVRHHVHPVMVEEGAAAGEAPEDYVIRVAGEKAAQCWEETADKGPRVVIGADTAVVVDEAILGKPADHLAAGAMLTSLSGRSHLVYSAVSGISPEGRETRLSRSSVTFRCLDPEEIAAYVASGEPMDKAGGYGIQGIAAIFAARLEGSYSGVMGLPLFETADLLGALGVPVLAPSPVTP
jgi:septum formation protein